MENNIILQGITVDQLLAKIDSIVNKSIKEKLESLKPPKAITYLDRKEVCRLLKISLPTLSSLTKDGAIISYRIGGRILYKLEDVEGALIKRRF